MRVRRILCNRGLGLPLRPSVFIADREARQRRGKCRLEKVIEWRNIMDSVAFVMFEPDAATYAFAI